MSLVVDIAKAITGVKLFAWYAWTKTSSAVQNFIKNPAAFIDRVHFHDPDWNAE